MVDVPPPLGSFEDWEDTLRGDQEFLSLNAGVAVPVNQFFSETLGLPPGLPPGDTGFAKAMINKAGFDVNSPAGHEPDWSFGMSEEMEVALANAKNIPDISDVLYHKEQGSVESIFITSSLNGVTFKQPPQAANGSPVPQRGFKCRDTEGTSWRVGDMAEFSNRMEAPGKKPELRSFIAKISAISVHIVMEMEDNTLKVIKSTLLLHAKSYFGETTHVRRSLAYFHS